MKILGTWLLMAALMFGMAYLFAAGWDLQENIDQAKRDAKIDAVLYPQDGYYSPPKTLPAPNPTYLAEPKVRYFQDASQPKGGK